jgi:carboxypeptidase C (cathepsin A)
MKGNHFRLFLTVCLLTASCLWAEQPKKEESASSKNACPIPSEEMVETVHEAVIDGQKIAYKAVAGNLLIKDNNCNPKASIFFISYTKEGVENKAERPITFCFNGGPGSSSVWLHLGTFGPKRVKLTDQGEAVFPYQLMENEYSILDLTDLVFIDPVSTGYSHAIPHEEAKNFHGLEEDIKAVSEFVRLYITRFNRWESPKFLAGESYGTTRAVGVAGYLQTNYIPINGLVLVSSVLNFQTIDCCVGNDLPYLLFVPSYTAAAWYHKKLSPELQNNFYEALRLSKEFVNREYVHALFQGDLLTPQERKRIISKLAYFTGLSPDYIEKSDLRIDNLKFGQELLRDQKIAIGRFDGRLSGFEIDPLSEYLGYDPSFSAISGAFTAAMNQYLRNDLRYERDVSYKILTNVQPWNYGGGADNQYVNVATTLRETMIKNPHLTVFVANGYFDLATPFFATEYTFNHLGFHPNLLKRVKMDYYEAGHTMYIHYPSLVKLKEDLRRYYMNSLREEKKS